MEKIRGHINSFIDSLKQYAKILFVFTAFSIMVIASCLIMNSTLSSKLSDHAEESINEVQTILERILSEPKVVLGFMAEYIEEILERGDGFEAVQAQMRYYSSDRFKERIPSFTFYSIFGFFDHYDEFYDGGGWIPSETYNPRSRPWYTAAVEDSNNVVISPVYIDTESNTPVIAFARSIYDDEGNLFGVVSIDVPVSSISRILDSKITENSYGFIIDDQSIIIAHPDEKYIGSYLVELSPDIVQLMYDIRDMDGITQKSFMSYTGIRSLLFSSETLYGWYVNFVVPEAEYYQDLYSMMAIVSILGLLLATILSVLLVQLEAAKNKSELKSMQKSNFLATMSHEIRTPMNSIIGFSELALDEDVSPKAQHYLISISDNAKWLLNIINDILDTAKIESGKIALEHIPYDLHDVISQCQSAILPKATEKGLEFTCSAEPIPNKTLVGDPVRLRQVFINLLSNAVKFTSKGTVKLSSSIKDMSDDRVTIHFEVKDSGIGMSNEQIERIFEPFMQGDDTVTRKFGGTGLGLPITKNILELMGGQLCVESKPGEGSIFSFDLTFDLLDEDGDIPTGVYIKGNVDKPNFEGEVLICEDNGLNQQVIRDHLTRVGLKTVVAENGQEGVDIVKSRGSDKPFDLIFMDIHMPVMDGLEAASQIAAMGIKTPIVALTANIMSHDLELYKENGMLDYLGKPFTSQDLWKCLLKYFKVISYSTVSEKTHTEEEDQALRHLRIYFARNNQDTIGKISQAIGDDDIKLAHRMAHTLKGNAGQIGETQLQELAKVLEYSLNDNEINGAKAQLKRVEAELQVVLRELAPLLTEADERGKNKISDNDAVRKILDELEPMLIKRNPECMNLVDDLHAIPGAEKLALHVEDFDFKEALEEFYKLKEELD